MMNLPLSFWYTCTLNTNTTGLASINCLSCKRMFISGQWAAYAHPEFQGFNETGQPTTFCTNWNTSFFFLFILFIHYFFSASIQCTLQICSQYCGVESRKLAWLWHVRFTCGLFSSFGQHCHCKIYVQWVICMHTWSLGPKHAQPWNFLFCNHQHCDEYHNFK